MLNMIKKAVKFYADTCETFAYNLPQFTASVIVPVAWFLN